MTKKLADGLINLTNSPVTCEGNPGTRLVHRPQLQGMVHTLYCPDC